MRSATELFAEEIAAGLLQISSEGRLDVLAMAAVRVIQELSSTEPERAQLIANLVRKLPGAKPYAGDAATQTQPQATLLERFRALDAYVPLTCSNVKLRVIVSARATGSYVSVLRFIDRQHDGCVSEFFPYQPDTAWIVFRLEVLKPMGLTRPGEIILLSDATEPQPLTTTATAARTKRIEAAARELRDGGKPHGYIMEACELDPKSIRRILRKCGS